MIIKENTTKEKIFFSALLLAMAVRFFALGFKYFPYLDDYIQYDVYKLYDAKYVFTYIGTIFTRPLAAVADYFVWSHFWNNMHFALAAILIMHFLTAYLLYVSFKKLGITLGTAFFVFFAFSPVIFEGIYWISASSRIVCGMFFAALSVYCFMKKRVLLFAVFNLISYLFYEQTMIFSLILAIFFAYKKDKAYALIPAANAVLTALYYLIFSKSGQFADRNTISFSISNIKKLYHIAENIDIASIFNFLHLNFILIAVFFSALLCFFGKKSEYSKEKLIIGILTVILPYLPYLFLNSVPAMRNTVLCAVGLGMIFDSVKYKKAYSMLLFFVCALFINSQLVMLSNQKKVYETDKIICRNLAPFIEENKSYYLIGAKGSYVNASLLNVTSSDWALTGAMRSHLNSKNIKLIVPIREDNGNKNFGKLYIDKFLKISK